MKRFMIQLPEAELKWLDAEASRLGLSRSAYMRACLAVRPLRQWIPASDGYPRQPVADSKYSPTTGPFTVSPFTHSESENTP